MTDTITCSTFEESTINVTEDSSAIITKVNEGTYSDSNYTFKLEGHTIDKFSSDIPTVTLSSPSSISPICTLDYIMNLENIDHLESLCKYGLRHLNEYFEGDSFPIIITCSISSSLSDATITLDGVKSKRIF